VSLFHCEFRPSSRDACDACGRPQYADISSLLDMLKSVPEPRGRRGRQYALEFILAVCIVATLSGAKNYREIATCAAGMPESLLRELGGKQDWFSHRWKSPCAGTIRLVLAKIDAAALDRITGGWLLTQARKHRRGGENAEWVIAVDGKVMRGAWTSENDKVTMFSAMLHEESVTIAQVRVPDGTNETTQVKALAHAAGIPDGGNRPVHHGRRAYQQENGQGNRRNPAVGLPCQNQERQGNAVQASQRNNQPSARAGASRCHERPQPRPREDMVVLDSRRGRNKITAPAASPRMSG